MAAGFHGSANIRCASSPSGGLSSRRAYLSSCRSFRLSWQIKHVSFYQLWILLNRLRLLTMVLVSEVSLGGKKPQGHLRWNLLHRWSLSPPPIRFHPCHCECASAFHHPVCHFVYPAWSDHNTRITPLFPTNYRRHKLTIIICSCLVEISIGLDGCWGSELKPPLWAVNIWLHLC